MKINTLPERYCHLFEIVSGQHIHLGKSVYAIWQQHLKKFQVTTGVNKLPCDLLLETDTSKSLNLIEKGTLDKLLTEKGSALLQVSKQSPRYVKLIKKLLTKYTSRNNKNEIRVALPDSNATLHYFALAIEPCFEVPNNIVPLLCHVDDGELCISWESANYSGSIAVVATKKDNPFSLLLLDLTGCAITLSKSAISRIMYRSRGTLIVEFKDVDDKQYISRSSLVTGGEKNIIKNYKILKSLHANPSISSDVKLSVPRIITSSSNSSIEDKKPGQLAWKIVRDNPDLEKHIIAQAWDFSFLLSEGTSRPVIIDGEAYDEIVGDDLEYIKDYCRDDAEVSKLLVLIDDYFRKQLLGSERFFVFSHGDFGYGNILCDDNTGKLTGVIDWDTSRDTELPGVDFFNLLIQKFRAQDRMDKSYRAAFQWLKSEDPLPAKIRTQLYDRFSITDEDLKLYSIISVVHLMGRDFQFHEAGSLRPEEKDTLILISSIIKNNHG